MTLARPARGGPPPKKDDGPRTNEQITAREVRLVDAEGNMAGVVSIDAALDAAAQAGMDLIEVSPDADPPVCKILDYGKWKYEAQKRANAARKKQKVIDIKEIKLRPNIDDHDYEVKMKNARRFLEDGDKVKVTLRFRGREMAHQELGMKLLHRVKDELEELSKVEAMPKMEGRQMIMVLAARA